MCRFLMFVKKFFLFIIIFVLLAGNICFSEELTLTTVMSAPPRIVRGIIDSSNPAAGGDGFNSAEVSPGEYLIDFFPDFPAGSLPTLVCIYMPIPGSQTGPKSQVVSVTNTKATVATVTVINPIGRVHTGAVAFIAIGSR